ncbi:MAG: PEP-CTERM sorting domain-containing protein [Pirellulales bacterium]
MLTTISCVAVAGMFALSSVAFAAPVLPQWYDFNDADVLAGGDLEDAAGGGGTGVAFPNGGAVSFGPLGSGTRSYLRTVDSSFTDVSWHAEIIVTVENDPGSFNDLDQSGFFGIGEGTRATASFGEPDDGAAIYMRITPDGNSGADDENGGVQVINVTDAQRVRDGNADAQDFYGGQDNLGTGTVGTGTHKIVMWWDNPAQELTFIVDADNDGSIDVTTTAYMQAELNNTNTHIFFGGAGGVTFDDLHIEEWVPEPTSGLLALVGALGFCTRRIRRRRR